MRIRMGRYRYVAAAATLLAASTAPAAVPNVTLLVKAAGTENIIRNDIGRFTFGGGVEHQNPQFRDAMSRDSNAQAAFRSFNLGTFRFPNGTTGLHYYWDRPKDSYISVTGPRPEDILTPDDVYKITGALNMERLFEVNTAQYLSPEYKLYPVIKPGSNPAAIEPQNLALAAGSAARWVAENTARPLSQRVNYWEIGNEDWVYWTPAEYARIFNEFGSRMKAVRPDIKLLAQSFTGALTPQGKPTNDYNWLQGLVNGGINTSQVYALSEHQYMDGGTFTVGSYNDQRIWQTQNMFAKVQNEWRIPYIKNVLKQNHLDWKIWMTEFNVAPKGPNGNLAVLQDLGHALVITDWVGKMLERGVDRLFMHSLDHNPYYALVNYVNDGGTIDSPRFTAPGYAFQKYAREFGKKMVRTEILGNATLSSPNSGSYDQVAAYSSVMESDPVYGGYPSLRVMVINRSTTDSANVAIKTVNRPIAGPSRNYYVQTLTSANISDSNRSQPDLVKWSARSAASSNTAAIVRTIPKNSAMFFVVPLQ